MPTYLNRYYHHSKELTEKCSICLQPFRYYWKDAEEQNGFSEITTEISSNSSAHFYCMDGAKSLAELNNERKHNHG